MSKIMEKFIIAESSKLKMFPKIEKHLFENTLNNISMFFFPQWHMLKASRGNMWITTEASTVRIVPSTG